MYEELIKALHGWNVYGQHLERCNCELAAADAIESLTAQLSDLQAENAEKDREIERLKKDAEGMRANWYKCSNNYREKCHAIKVLESALARVEAERDAACEAICDRCEYVPCRREACMWWRGAQGEG